MSVDPEPPPQPAVPQPPIGGADRQLPAPSQAPAAPAAADVADETQTAGGTDASQRKVEEPNDEEAGTARDVVVSENGLAEPTFVSFRKERVQKEDGTRWNLFHLVDDSAGEQLAVIGEERETKDGHYVYRCAEPFTELGAGPWGNAGSVHDWLNGVIRQQAAGQPLGLWGRSSSAGATSMDWQPAASGPKGAEGGEGGAEKGGSPKRPARELDVWPPPPPPDRSQLPLAKLPRVSLPEPPVPPQPKPVAEIQTAAAQSRAAALAGLIARAEKLHQQRSAAVTAALDWLSGDLPADEVELLKHNISNLAETLAELDALPPVPPKDGTPHTSNAGVSAATAAGGEPVAPGSGVAVGLPIALSLLATPAQRQQASTDAAGSGAPDGQDPLKGGAAVGGATTAAGSAPNGLGGNTVNGTTAATLCNGHTSPKKGAAGEDGRVAALSARGRLITEALDFLREVTSTFMPLPVQAATGTVEAIAAASLHQDEAVSLLARESLGALRRVAEVHLATLASPDVLEDPRTALAARLPTIAAAADAVAAWELSSAAAAARNAAARAATSHAQATMFRAPSLPRSSSQQLQAGGGVGGASACAQPATPPATSGGIVAAGGPPAPTQPPLGADDSMLEDGEALVKPTTKPRTPHAKFLQAKSTAKAAAAAAAAVKEGATIPAAAAPSAPAPLSPTRAPPALPAVLSSPAAPAAMSSLGSPTGPGGVDEDAGEEEDDSDPENEWHTSDDGEETFQIDDDPNAGPIGNAVKVLRQGKGRLSAARYSKVKGVAHALAKAALLRLEIAAQWRSDASFRESVKERAALLQRNACRLSRDKAISTNRKAKASVMKDADALLKAAEAYAA